MAAIAFLAGLALGLIIYHLHRVLEDGEVIYDERTDRGRITRVRPWRDGKWNG